MTFEEIYKKYPMNREDMDETTERQFVNDCFDAYELEGFAEKFWSPYESLKDYCGKPFVVVKRCTKEDYDLECLPAWKIEFEWGEGINAYPEEIIPSEMKANGFPW